MTEINPPKIILLLTTEVRIKEQEKAGPAQVTPGPTLTSALSHVSEVGLRASIHRRTSFPLPVPQTLNHATDVVLLKRATFYKRGGFGCEENPKGITSAAKTR